MKTLLILFIVLLVSISGFAQQGINYKAVIKDGSGNLLGDTFMNVQFTIHQSTETGTIVYQEDHNYTTDANGLLILNIGTDPSPSVGVFADLAWGADLHFLQTSITYSGGTIDFNATEFMAVPYALHAANVSGLEKINENGQTGWRLKSVDPANYGDIGLDAVDLSINTSFINGLMGATGEISTALGTQTTASGVGSTAMGIGSEASGVVSTAIGYTTIASGLASVAVGNSNIDIPSAIFLIGNGDFNLGDPIRSNALEVYQNGTITAPSFDLAEITDDKALVTKEYVDTNLPNAPSGLRQFTWTENTGWKLIGAYQSGFIGSGAIDMSQTSSVFAGARGAYSFAVGRSTDANGSYSSAFGYNTKSPSYGETVIGSYNEIYTPLSSTTWNNNDRLFVIGNGATSSARNNALTVLKNGTITAPSFDISEITDDKALVTKEYADANYSSSNNNFLIDGGNDVSNNVGIGTLNPQSLFEVAHDNTTPITSNFSNSLSIKNNSNNGSWQFFTSGGGGLLLYKNGSFRGSFSGTNGGYTQASDRRVKKDITALENGTLNKVMQLNPVSYLMKEQTDTKRNLGLISQEVQEIFPTLTSYVDGQDLLALSYTELIPILIKALQEQQNIIDGQNIKIDAQNSKIAAQHSENTQQNQAIQSLLQRMTALETANNQ